MDCGVSDQTLGLGVRGHCPICQFVPIPLQDTIGLLQSEMHTRRRGMQLNI